MAGNAPIYPNWPAPPLTQDDIDRANLRSFMDVILATPKEYATWEREDAVRRQDARAADIKHHQDLEEARRINKAESDRQARNAALEAGSWMVPPKSIFPEGELEKLETLDRMLDRDPGMTDEELRYWKEMTGVPDHWLDPRDI